MKSLGLFWILLMLLAFTCKADRKRGFETLENERELVSNFKSFVHDVWNERDMDRFEALSAENYAKNLNGVRVVNNRSEAEVQLNGYFMGFPDARVSTADIVVKDHHLFTQWVFSGTNTGRFAGTAPTGKKIEIKGYSKVLFNKEGKIIREDAYYNELEMFRQLGYTLNAPIME